MKLCLAIITKNEEIHLERLLKNVKKIVDAVYIVDSYSNDKTLKIAKKYKCKIFKRNFDNFSNQRNYCLSKIPKKFKWILFLDADEYLSLNLKKEITDVINSNKYDAYKIKRRFIFEKTWIKRGYYPKWFVRLGRNGIFKCDNKKINEHLLCKSKKIGELTNDFYDHNLKKREYWYKKHQQYSRFESERYFEKEDNIKRILWNFLPLILRPFILFFYRIIIKMSFLDGINAVKYHFLHDLYYRLLIDVKIIKKIISNK